MTPTQRQAMQDAIDTLGYYASVCNEDDQDTPAKRAQAALRAALAAPVQEPIKPPGMAVQALAGEIIEALLADEKDGGYDLTAGLFGAEFSKLVRRWAVAEWNAPQAQQPAEVPLLTIGELADLTGPWAHIRSDYSIGIARATEKLIRQKAGLP